MQDDARMLTASPQARPQLNKTQLLCAISRHPPQPQGIQRAEGRGGASPANPCPGNRVPIKQPEPASKYSSKYHQYCQRQPPLRSQGGWDQPALIKRVDSRVVLCGHLFPRAHAARAHDFAGAHAEDALAVGLGVEAAAHAVAAGEVAGAFAVVAPAQ